jgi:hypothetical protein
MAATALPASSDVRSVIARTGLVGRALLYVVFGLLALDVAAGAGGRDDTRGAVERVAGGGWGRILLVALCVGLVALVVWRVMQAVAGDPLDGEEPSDRARLAGKAVVYAGVFAAAVAVLLAEVDSGRSSGGASGDSTKEEAASSVLQLPGGRWLLVGLGITVAAFAVYQFVRNVVRAEFMERIDDRRVDEAGTHVIDVAGRAGYGSLSVMMLLIGGFLVIAGIRGSSEEVEGTAGAIQELGRTGWGGAVLWVIAAGLLAFAAFSVVEAWLRRVA